MSEKQKKPFYKRWWFIAIVAIVIIGALGGEEEVSKEEVSVEPTEEVAIEEEKTEELEEEVEEEKEVDLKEDETLEEDPEETAASNTITWDDMKENIIGKSDKDFLEITERKPTDVRNDNTGKWKKNTIAKNIDTVEYALSYTDLYMEDGDTHFIINFNYNTTTVLNHMSGLIYADVKEYVDKEEHDANVLGSGMLLKSYIVYPDGDIEEVQ